MSVAGQSNHLAMVQLAKRALDHYQDGTTDMAPAIMRMPIEAYTSESRYLAERERIFRHLPLALALTIEVPEPGDYKAMTVLGTPVLISRGDDGKARAFHLTDLVAEALQPLGHINHVDDQRLGTELGVEDLRQQV